jgi:hypothetical protein
LAVEASVMACVKSMAAQVGAKYVCIVSRVNQNLSLR